MTKVSGKDGLDGEIAPATVSVKRTRFMAAQLAKLESIGSDGIREAANMLSAGQEGLTRHTYGVCPSDVEMEQSPCPESERSERPVA